MTVNMMDGARDSTVKRPRIFRARATFCGSAWPLESCREMDGTFCAPKNRKEQIRAARVRGLPEWRVIVRHGLKNAILPVITQMSQMSVSLLCGSAVIESIYAVNGIGRLSLQAVYAQDLPVLQCFILLVTAFVIVMNLLVDILYSAIDVRIRLAMGKEQA